MTDETGQKNESGQPGGDQDRLASATSQTDGGHALNHPGGSGSEDLEPQLTDLEKKVIEALRTVYDPEIPVNIYELGLIYEMNVDEQNRGVHVKMTLTAPGCPVAGTFPDTVRMTVEGVDGIESCEVELVWYPPWTPDMMSEAARLELGFF